MTLFIGKLQPEPLAAPISVARPPSLAEISVVIPVRDNAAGAERLARWWSRLPVRERPREMILVDDASRVPLSLQGRAMRVLRGAGRGPAAARNVGWRAAAGDWVAFVDSDCIPAAGWPGAFARGWAGEIAVQGKVVALGEDWLSAFYESQGVLRPMSWSADGRPGYLITANALVYRPVLERVGGFSERFPSAAGDDVDMGLRLAAAGLLRYSPEAVVAHDFERSLTAFVQRFLRYGRGNRLLCDLHNAGTREFFAPRLFAPRSRRTRDVPLAALAFGALWAGWMLESRLAR